MLQFPHLHRSFPQQFLGTYIGLNGTRIRKSEHVSKTEKITKLPFLAKSSFLEKSQPIAKTNPIHLHNKFLRNKSQ